MPSPTPDTIKTTDQPLNLRITGGTQLSGSINTRTSKNTAVCLLCAALLNKNTTTLKRVPHIEEVYRLIEVLESIGVIIEWHNGDLIIRPPQKLKLSEIDRDAAMRTRSIILFLGPLIHITHSFTLPQAGGCKLGARTVQPHLYALEKLGVRIATTTDTYEISRDTLTSGEIILYESGDTVTENALMAAALIAGKTTIKYASANYQVQDLCHFLQELGVKIEGIGSTTLTVHGIDNINTPVTYSISEDPIDSMFLIATAIVTASEITITHVPLDFVELELFKLEKMGLRYTTSSEYTGENEHVRLADITIMPSDLTAPPDKIEARPYPGLNIDNLPFFAVIATQADGQTLIHDWVYETRAIYYKELDKLGAETILADPHRIYINGPTPLKPAEVICPPALRPAAIILIGMLGAEGTSMLRNIYSINRGYEDIVNRLNAIGAKIKILETGE